MSQSTEAHEEQEMAARARRLVWSVTAGMKTPIASILLIQASAGNGLAGDSYESSESGNTLLAKCVGAPAVQLFCGGYTTAIYDMINFLEASKLIPKRHCFPPGVSRGQIRDVIVHYLQIHPEELHTGAGYLGIEALQGAWPCNAGSTTPPGR